MEGSFGIPPEKGREPLTKRHEVTLQKREGEETGEGVTALLPRSTVEVRRPPLYKVLLHNDDYTPMEFVVEILESVFKRDHTMATKIMMDVHEKGKGVCGVYPYEIAETKVSQVTERALRSKFPLKCSMEEA